MNNNNKEKVNMYFLIIMLIMLILLIFYSSYKEEYDIFVQDDNEIVKRYDEIKDINTYLSEFNLSYSTSNYIDIINSNNINKFSNNTFNYTDRVEKRGIYFVGELDEEGYFYRRQINDMNHVLRFMETSQNIFSKNESFKYCIYISDNNFSSLYPYGEDGVDNVYYRYLMSTIEKTIDSASDIYNISSNNGLGSKIWIGIDYVEEYDEYFETISIDYKYSQNYEKFSGKIYFTFYIDPERYLKEDKYENFILYTDLDMLHYEDGVIKIDELDELLEVKSFENIEKSLEFMTNTNMSQHTFETANSYFKVTMLGLSNNIIISKVSKLQLIKSAAYSSIAYIIILVISLFGFVFFLFEVQSIKRLDTLFKRLEIANKRLMMVDKVDDTTGLLNRRAVPEYANEIQKMFYVIIISINSVKFINEFYGYEIVDNLILAIANTLSDFFDDNHKVIRWGGKDFMVLYYGKHSENVKEKCKQLDEEVKRLIVTDNLGQKINFTISIAVSKKSNYSDGFETINEAERTMQYLKKMKDKRLLTFSDMQKLEEYKIYYK